MGWILAIETATPVCSVALGLNGEVTRSRETTTPNSHASQLTIFIDELMRDSGLDYPSLDAVAVSMGPGSYTGLRIGLSTAKGLCYALDKPLIGILTLEGIAAALRSELRAQGSELRAQGSQKLDAEGRKKHLNTSILPYIHTLILPLIDARRMEVYMAVYDEDLNQIEPPHTRIIEKDSLDALAKNHNLVLGGNGAEKCIPFFGEKSRISIINGLAASAQYLLPLAEKKFTAGDFENLAYCEPFYLKDFVAGAPKVKGLF